MGFLLLADLIVTAVNAFFMLHNPSPMRLAFLLVDLLSFIFLLGLWWFNRAGYTTAASYLFLIGVIAIISLGFPMDSLDRVILLYAIPILSASFLLSTRCSLLAASLSILGYSLRFLYEQPPFSYNYISVFTLFIVALIAWVIAHQLESALQQSNQQQSELAKSKLHDRILFEQSPIALWEEDFSLVKTFLDDLHSQGVSDIHAYLSKNPDALQRCLSLVRVLDANQSALKMAGCETLQELQAEPVNVLQRSPQENSVLLDELAAIARGEIVFEGEGSNDVVDGKIRYHHVQFAVVPGHESDYSKVIFSIQDITERIEIEETLRFQSELLDQIGDLIIATDLDGNITYANQAECRLFQKTRQELIGKNVVMFGNDPEHDITQQDIIEKTRSAGSWSGEIINTLPDGSKVLLFCRTWLLQDEEGRAVGMCSVATDITASKRMEEELIEAQKLAGIGTLAAGVAHEINSPLQIITGLSGSILRRMDQGPLDMERLRRNVQNISQSSWRVAEIVRSLLAYSRASSGAFQPANINTLVQDSLILLENLMHSESNVTFSTHLADNLPLIPCNYNEISQVLVNLLTNARDAMPHGGKIVISTSLSADGREALLQVSDTGKGIAAEHLERIFEPFFTTKPAGKGTGLGLAICQRIVRAHGGDITVSSIPGEGTTFTIHLPLKPPSQQNGAPMDIALH